MAIRPHKNGAKGQKKKLPHTTVQRFLSWGLPVSCSRFLWRQRGEFPVSAFLLGAGTGGLLAIGLFQLLVNPMNIYEDQKMVTLYSLVGLGAIGWGTSPHIRCASLLLVPKMLGKEGRLFVLGYALAAIYEGPVANLRHNLNEVIASLGCTVELQINNTRSAWRVSTAPLRAVFKDLLSSKESLKAKTQNITNSFEELDAQVNSESGYAPEDAEGSEETAPGRETLRASAFRHRLSTQKMYELKTKLRCSHVVNKAMITCRRWFDQKHRECIRRIWVPLLNHLLCLPMKFKFFCGIVKVMEVWCRSRIPVEGNFGQTYDSLNQSIHSLEGEFSATINLKEEKRAGVLGLNVSWEHVSTEVRDYVRRQEAQLEWVLGLLHALFSCTFLLVLHACFSYMDSYNGDIRFDNIYISTYFCQIDERRKKLGKQTLLPLRRAEKKTVIFPWDPAIQASEMRNVVRELMETLPVVLLLLLLCGLDWALYSIFDTIRHHSFVQYSFRSSHKLEVKVGGDSMLARLLRNTIGALNTSSETVVESNNMPCLPQPVPLSTRAYLRAALPSSLLVCLCLLQAFGYRLRRVIVAFYFPKREKKRILFLYNELLRKRAAFTQLRRATIVRRAREQRASRRHLADILHRRCLPLLRPWLRRRCVVCQAPETPESYVCPTPDCEAVYCRSCWNDMRQRCPVCTPREELSSSAYSDSNDDATYAE
ncbi:LOW QUALITY PROTEIN: E3 ubiquitin-protein ligase DCST1 [Physeter macrocephalus]|uniref:LOW QUALITY PROTEIN: E3 ubiquitin-protein ligase DCST1 n=1 Tax=Physeter macrocephalus TaxID=9755 RepID=A0A2Y9ETU2_PHYMC|nr:LOW QUALITY PROTEIN: E3 ubiquitin-protein ligase DCST1 [Physeter catodon]|eukprot:XP_007108956.1 LOW QUALITY PROTEIN: E3 ubiquitin-protein ligase DCST1 [Physeter catodon]